MTEKEHPREAEFHQFWKETATIKQIFFINYSENLKSLSASDKAEHLY